MEVYEKVAAGVAVAMMVLTAGLAAFVWASNDDQITKDRSGGMLSTFSSRGKVFDFLGSSERSGVSYYDSSRLTPTGAKWEMDESSPSHSTTNVQVAGVDELDEVKTDGNYIYISNWDSVSILDAYPATDLANVSMINESTILGHDDPDVWITFSGIFVLDQKLVVICTWNEYHEVLFYDDNISSKVEWPNGGAEQYGPRSYVMIFDVGEPSDPVLERAVGVSGYVQTARMIDDRVYLIAQDYSWAYAGDVGLPRVWIGDESKELSLNSIFYDPEMRDAYSFLNILSVNITNHDQDCVSLIAGYASTIYMSRQAIYLTIQKWTGNWAIGVLEDGSADEPTVTTTLFKIEFDGLTMKATARGDVTGWLLNQFSMDEHNGYLRVATTDAWFERVNGTTQSNNVFILDSDLGMVGSLTGIAPNERIFSSRFVGDTLYLVTFRQIDPLFVIDLSNPDEPKITGELEVPGFSSYLHPVDDTHLLGIGRESNSVKISLYDVSDPAAPVEQSKFVFAENSWSSADYDHRAVLIDLEKNLLVIPISWYEVVATSEYYSSYTYHSGALVMNISVQDGISMRGVVSHASDIYGSEYVFRSLYIEDNLYTISYTTVKASALSDLSEISSLVYRSYEYRGYYNYAL